MSQFSHENDIKKLEKALVLTTDKDAFEFIQNMINKLKNNIKMTKSEIEKQIAEFKEVLDKTTDVYEVELLQKGIAKLEKELAAVPEAPKPLAKTKKASEIMREHLRNKRKNKGVVGIKAEFTKFNKDDQFVSGIVDDYTFEAKLFDDTSDYGIRGGRVSKLDIRDNNKKVVLRWDRGWDIKPTKEVRPYYKAVIHLLENAPKRFQEETETTVVPEETQTKKEIKFTRVHKREATGTGRKGYLNAKYDKIVEAFGKPEKGSDYKTEVEWVLRFGDGSIATIYDYKTGKAYLGEKEGVNPEQITDWHIGGRKISDEVIKIIERETDGDYTPASGYKFVKGGGVGEELMGGQPQSEPTPSGAILLEFNKGGKEIIVSEDGGKTKELYVKNNGFSGYTLRYKGNQYEFVSSFAKGGGLPINDERIGRVVDEIKRRIEAKKIEYEYVSPNYVADMAWNMGIKDLTSEEVVYISDNIEKFAKGGKVNREQVNYFVEKFGMRMKGHTPQTAVGWVDGIGELNDDEKRAVWKGIQDHIDYKHHKDFDKPDWVSGESGTGSVDKNITLKKMVQYYRHYYSSARAKKYKFKVYERVSTPNGLGTIVGIWHPDRYVVSMDGVDYTKPKYDEEHSFAMAAIWYKDAIKPITD